MLTVKNLLKLIITEKIYNNTWKIILKFFIQAKLSALPEKMRKE
jgi:hypothetical protein